VSGTIRHFSRPRAINLGNAADRVRGGWLRYLQARARRQTPIIITQCAVGEKLWSSCQKLSAVMAVDLNHSKRKREECGSWFGRNNSSTARLRFDQVNDLSPIELRECCGGRRVPACQSGVIIHVVPGGERTRPYIAGCTYIDDNNEGVAAAPCETGRSEPITCDRSVWRCGYVEPMTAAAPVRIGCKQ
jgi:hypothetical protein